MITKLLGGILETWRRILELARRPDDEEYRLFLKIIFLGLFLVGAIAFTIRSIAIFLLSGGT
jgi:protein translocase SEC61 complex gamma subunit